MQPYGKQSIPVTFSPQVESSYLDTLWISSNDIEQVRVPILLIGKSATGNPKITSADTATAIEHEFFYYIPQAIDPDGDEIEFRFNNFPNWLRASVDSIYGVPPEGAKDSGFTVIASDGFLEDSLDVFLRVIPVNDPPLFEYIQVQQIIEQDQLSFAVKANDPEQELLTLSAHNLPQGSGFVDGNNNTGTFNWNPPFRSAGTYDITFIARETISNPALSDTMVVRINVGRRQPDIIVSDLKLSRTDIRLNQDATISAQIKNENAPVLETFLIRISMDGTAIFDTTITGMQPDDSFNISTSTKFIHLGTTTVAVDVDVNKVVPETNETNNRLELAVSITRGALIVRPNPFTPNGDSKNDIAFFDMTHLAMNEPILNILDMNGRLIQTLRNSQNNQLQWNGKNTNGVEQLPGVYLFILQDGAKNVAKGYIVLAR